MFTVGEVGGFLNASLITQIIKEKAFLGTNLLTSASLLVILVTAGLGVIVGQWSWSIVLVYLIALRYFLRSVNEVSSRISEASRHYPHIKRYYEFITDAERALVAPPMASISNGMRLKLPSLSDDRQTLCLTSGQRFILLHPRSTDRSLVRMFLDKTVLPPVSWGDPYWFVGDTEYPDSALRESLGFPATLTNTALLKQLQALLPTEFPARIRYKFPTRKKQI